MSELFKCMGLVGLGAGLDSLDLIRFSVGHEFASGKVFLFQN